MALPSPEMTFLALYPRLCRRHRTERGPVYRMSAR